MAEREGKSRRGFASMDPQRQREIASKGGKAAHAKGTAHEFDSDEARRAGRKGGEVVSRNREHMAEIGRRGGEARGENRAQTRGSSRGERGERMASADRGVERANERVSRDTMGRSGIERERQSGDGSPGLERGAGLGGRELGERDRLAGERAGREPLSRESETR